MVPRDFTCCVTCPSPVPVPVLQLYGIGNLDGTTSLTQTVRVLSFNPEAPSLPRVSGLESPQLPCLQFPRES